MPLRVPWYDPLGKEGIPQIVLSSGIHISSSVETPPAIRMADLVPAPVTVVAAVVVVVVCVSSRHEMRHLAPLAVPFLSDTNLKHLIKYQWVDKNISTLILASFLLWHQAPSCGKTWLRKYNMIILMNNCYIQLTFLHWLPDSLPYHSFFYSWD